MSARRSIGKKLRFDVFKRDGFVCVYCGNPPTDSPLEVDHVVPVAAGGQNDIENLVTSCNACNQGKGAIPLDIIPMSLEEKAAEVAEREAQVRAYYDLLEARKQRLDDELWAIADIFMERFGDESILRVRLASIRSFLGRVDFFEVQEAMEIATSRVGGRVPTFSYFCGICWRKIRETGQ